MAEEVLSTYLRNKFSSILQEAEDDRSSPSQILQLFRSIERQINFMCENTGTTTNRASPIQVYLLYELIDALSECRILAHRRHKAAASKKGFFRVITVDFLSEYFFKRTMRKRLDKIETKLKNGSEGTGPSPSVTVIEQTYPILDPSVIIGFESQVEKIEGLLLMRANNNLAAASIREREADQGFTAIGILGRCGCGKTALAQKVFANPRIQEEFSPRIWVCLSTMLLDNNKRVDPRVRVLNYILEEIGHDVSELEYAEYDFISVVVNKLLEKLQRGLRGKKYLIVLDAAWRVDEWYADLGYRLPSGSATGKSFSHGLPKGSGGAIIVTSRRENVIRRMIGDKHVIQMEPHLSNEICWNIFSNVVRQQGKMNSDHHQKLTNMKDDVIQKCDGLPLAAKTLANIICCEL